MSDQRVSTRRIRVCYFNTWAEQMEPAVKYVARARSMDLTPRVSDPRDSALMKKARLDCDWYAENARCFAAMTHASLEFLPAWITGREGVLEVARAPRELGEERWLVTMGHQPQALGELAGKVFALLAKTGVRNLFYAFDEASRFMASFGDIAPHLDVLIHDESPLDPAGRARVNPGCVDIHRSWVANEVPFAVAFNEQPEDKIMFLGSELGLSEHRRRQIEFLKRHFGDRFVAYHDHSIAIADRAKLNRIKVALCPEGRKFATPAMARTHTDRPFWSGCLGMVPVSEDSKVGGRLQELHEGGLIVRYEHGNLKSLAEACERALVMTDEERRRIYEHFNRHETVGTVVADAIAGAQPR